MNRPRSRSSISNTLRRSSSLTIEEWACSACIPLLLIIEAIVYSFSQCFDLHTEQRVPHQTHQRWRHLSFRQLTQLAHDSHCFTVNEVEALYELYKKLSSSADGVLHKEELYLALLMNPSSHDENLFLDRFFHLFDQKRNSVIEFEEFVKALSIYHPNAPIDDKIDFLFTLYDLRQTGYIEREEVKQMVKASLMESDWSLSDDVLERIMNQTFEEADMDRDGRISMEEWKAFALKHPSLLRRMTVHRLRDLTTVFPSFIFNTAVED